tara:strand:- start:290 stop:481 length:192 start_codon:yes stop_codon:yes gene_type:complete
MPKQPTPTPKFYSIQDCASILNVDYRYIYDRVVSGEIPSIKLSAKMIRIPILQFDKWCQGETS